MCVCGGVYQRPHSRAIACVLRAQEGWTPLHLSCDKGHKTCADALLAAGSDVNACDEGRPTPLHLTPLHLASMNGHSRCIRSLLGAGAVPDAKDSVSLAV